MSSGKLPSSLVAVVVTYNGLHWIDRCLASLRDSTLPTGIIVVDNGSTDGTRQRIAEAFPDVELVLAEKNLGFGQANNIGIRSALEQGATHVFLLNQDAWVLPDTLGKLVESSNHSTDHGVLSPLHLNGKGDALDLAFSNYIAPLNCPNLYSDLVLRLEKTVPYPLPFVNAAAWLMTSLCIRTVGGFNPSFGHYGEDDNYMHRMRYHGLKAGIVPTARIHHDREDRVTSSYFDPTILQQRQLRLAFADPDRALDPKEEITFLRKVFLKNLLSLQRTQAQKARERIRAIRSSVDAKLLSDRALSRQRGTTFL